MVKTRNMLGKIDDPAIIQMMRVIETQSKKTLSKWSSEYAEKYLFLSMKNNLLRIKDLAQLLRLLTDESMEA